MNESHDCPKIQKEPIDKVAIFCEFCSVIIKVCLKANAQFNNIKGIRRSGDEHVRTQVVTSDKRRRKMLLEVDIESTMI